MTSLSDLVSKAASEIDAADDLAALDAVRVSYLGKKGEITARLKTLGQLPPEERSAAGQEINQAKQEVQGQLIARREALEAAALEAKLAADAVDVSLPGRGLSVGGYHRRLAEDLRPSGVLTKVEARQHLGRDGGRRRGG